MSTFRPMPSPSRYCLRACISLSFIFLAFCSETSSARDSLLTQVRGVKGISVPLGNVQGLPTVIFRCGEITAERRRLGVLSLGILPRYVFRDVIIEVTGRGEPHQWMEDLSAFVSSEQVVHHARADKLNIRHLVTRVEIEARQAEFSGSLSSREIRMRGVLHRQGDGLITQLPEAVVSLSAPENEALGPTAAERVTNDTRGKMRTVISLQ